MKSVIRIAKWTACIFGGASAAAFLACVIAVLLFGLHDAESGAAFLGIWARVAGGLGAAAGAFIVFGSEKRARA
jgi:hypothetical protein